MQAGSQEDLFCLVRSFLTRKGYLEDLFGLRPESINVAAERHRTTLNGFSPRPDVFWMTCLEKSTQQIGFDLNRVESASSSSDG